MNKEIASYQRVLQLDADYGEAHFMLALAFDMAVANLFGSNLVNILILVPEDLLYSEGPILAAVSPLHTSTGGSMHGLVAHGFEAGAWSGSRPSPSSSSGSRSGART